MDPPNINYTFILDNNFIDIIADKTPKILYRWEKSDKRKVEVTITTGLGIDRKKISQISIRCRLIK